MGGCEGGNLEVLWGAAGAIAQELAYRERPGTGGSRCGGSRGNVRASLLSGGISHPVEYLQASTGDPPTFPALFANAASELPPWHTMFSPVLPCSWAAVFQIRSCTCLTRSLLLHSACGSFPCLGHSSRSCCSGGRLCSLSNEIQKCEFCDY